MRKIEKIAAELALKSSTNNEPVWVQGFHKGVEYTIQEGAKQALSVSDKANKLLKVEDPLKPYSASEKLELQKQVEIGRAVAAKLSKILEEEVD